MKYITMMSALISLVISIGLLLSKDKIEYVYFDVEAYENSIKNHLMNEEFMTSKRFEESYSGLFSAGFAKIQTVAGPRIVLAVGASFNKYEDITLKVLKEINIPYNPVEIKKKPENSLVFEELAKLKVEVNEIKEDINLRNVIP